MRHEIVSQIINFQVIPVVLLPVSGLALLVFYNRAAAINQRLRLVQKELRDILISVSSPEKIRLQEMIRTLQKELKLLTKRIHLIGCAMIGALSAIFLFTICAIFITATLFYSWAIDTAIVFWFAGPVLVCFSIICGITELLLSYHSLRMQSLLIEKWDKEN